MVLSDEQVKQMNERIAAAKDQVDLPLPNASDKLVVQMHTNPSGAQSLVLQIKSPDGSLRPSLNDRADGPMITFNTPLSTVTGAYSVSPRRFSSTFDGTSSLEPNAALYIGPAGDVAQWNRDMKAIDGDLIKAFASALKQHGTCIPKDPFATTVAKKSSKLSAAQYEEWVAEQLAGHGSPHMPSSGKRTTTDSGEREGPFRFGKKLFQPVKMDGRPIATEYDCLLGSEERIAEIRQSLPPKAGGKFAPVPIFVGGKLVPPDEYDDIADRLQGSVVYVEGWAKLFTNTKNKVLSLKCGVFKVVISQLADATGRGNSVVDVSSASPGEKRAAVDVSAILDIASSGGAKRARP